MTTTLTILIIFIAAIVVVLFHNEFIKNTKKEFYWSIFSSVLSSAIMFKSLVRGEVFTFVVFMLAFVISVFAAVLDYKKYFTQNK